MRKKIIDRIAEAVWLVLLTLFVLSLKTFHTGAILALSMYAGLFVYHSWRCLKEKNDRCYILKDDNTFHYCERMQNQFKAVRSLESGQLYCIPESLKESSSNDI